MINYTLNFFKFIDRFILDQFMHPSFFYKDTFYMMKHSNYNNPHIFQVGANYE